MATENTDTIPHTDVGEPPFNEPDPCEVCGAEAIVMNLTHSFGENIQPLGLRIETFCRECGDYNEEVLRP